HRRAEIRRRPFVLAFSSRRSAVDNDNPGNFSRFSLREVTHDYRSFSSSRRNFRADRRASVGALGVCGWRSCYGGGAHKLIESRTWDWKPTDIEIDQTIDRYRLRG